MSKLAIYSVVICQSLMMALASESNAQHKYLKEIHVELAFEESTIELKELIKSIEASSQFHFAFSKGDVRDKEIQITSGKWNLMDLMNEISTQGQFSIRRINETITLMKVENQPLPQVSERRDVQTSVSGKITDENGQPLPGATIQEKGTTNGTITDVEGNFSLNVPADALLTVSFVGYQTREINLNGRSVLDVSLEADISALEEVVVIGYGSVKKSDLTGSVSSVSQEEINNVAVQSVDQALRGRVPGMKITKRNGQPGAGSIIQIRGINSIQGGNEPLIIVDGFPLTGGLDFIDPNEISSVEVLKDASATAIYGARAANGVIIINTKKGTSETMKISFDSYYGIQSIVKRIDLANAQEFMEIANARAVNDGESQLFFPNPSSISVDTDWQDLIFQSAPIQRHNLVLSGGNSNLRYSLSGNYFQQEGVVKGSDFKKFTIRSNIDADMNKIISITNSMIIARTDQNSSGDLISAAFQASPTLAPFDAQGNYKNLNPYTFNEGIENPIGMIDGITNRDLVTRIFDNFGVTFNILDDLSFKSSVGIDYEISRGENYTASYLLAGTPGGRASLSNRESYSILNENIFSFNKTIGDFKLDAVAGYTSQVYKATNFSAGSSNFVTDDLLYNALGSGSVISIPSSGTTDWGISSWLGRVNLNIKEKYLLTFSGRSDGSSRFAEGNKWAFFPSGAMAWRISEEDWFGGGGKISNLKLRLSYGKTGNQGVSPYQTLLRMSPIQMAFGDDLNIGFAPANIANKKLKWETTTQYDAGIDFDILDGRLRFTADYYYKLTTDLLAQVNLPSSAGFGSSTQNIGSMSNRGIELLVEATAIDRIFKWNTSINLYANRNQIVKLSKGADVFAPNLGLLSSMHILREGEPISMFYGYVWDGIDENTGRDTYKDLNEDGMINDLDRKIIGSPHPDLNVGFNNTLTYSNFQLTFLLEGAFGQDILNIAGYEHADSFYKGRNQLSEVANDYWSLENTNAKYPRPSASVAQLPSDNYVENGSFVKIRHINLSYSLPVDQINWISNARIYLSGENLFTFTKYSWYDPEISHFGGGDLRLGTENRSYPQSRTISIGLNVGF